MIDIITMGRGGVVLTMVMSRQVHTEATSLVAPEVEAEVGQVTNIPNVLTRTVRRGTETAVIPEVITLTRMVAVMT